MPEQLNAAYKLFVLASNFEYSLKRKRPEQTFFCSGIFINLNSILLEHAIADPARMPGLEVIRAKWIHPELAAVAGAGTLDDEDALPQPRTAGACVAEEGAVAVSRG